MSKLTKPQKDALVHVTENPNITPAELAVKMGISNSGAGLILGRLKSKGIGQKAAPATEETVAGEPATETESDAPPVSGRTLSLEGFVNLLRGRLAIKSSACEADTDEKVHAKASYLAKAWLDESICALKREHGWS